MEHAKSKGIRLYDVTVGQLAVRNGRNMVESEKRTPGAICAGMRKTAGIGLVHEEGCTGSLDDGTCSTKVVEVRVCENHCSNCGQRPTAVTCASPRSKGRRSAS
jgi:hypothetical protein